MRVNIDTVYRRDGNEVTVRKRDTSLTIRLTPGEKELIFLRAKQKHLCVTDYIVASGIQGEWKIGCRSSRGNENEIQ